MQVGFFKLQIYHIGGNKVQLYSFGDYGTIHVPILYQSDPFKSTNKEFCNLKKNLFIAMNN